MPASWIRQKKLARVFASLTGLDNIPKWLLVLDRTYWMFGKTHLTFLYMGVSCGSYCIPLFFIGFTGLQQSCTPRKDGFDVPDWPSLIVLYETSK
jgi:hypothetical protein